MRNNKINQNFWKVFSVVLLVISASFIVQLFVPFFLPHALADTAAELQQKIDARNAQIKALEDEINTYNKQVDTANVEAKTLQGTIKSLDLTQKKITTDITLTGTKINKTNLTIEQIGGVIATSTNQINKNKKAIAEAFRNTQRLDSSSIIELILSNKSILDAWNDINETEEIQAGIKDKTSELATLKKTLESKQMDLQEQKDELQALTNELNAKKQAVVVSKQEKATLLTETKNKEQTYKQMIKDREAQKAQFEKEVFDFESQLKIAIDATSYPGGKKGILSWPLDKVRITQLFGKTVGAEKLYVSGSHNGVDFGASVGTKVKNVLTGVVVGTGDTDIYPGCYSFGRWVMVKHPNGLSTIYGHLSVISVQSGQQLQTGDLIGLSGNTGYSTGPHLHISVYATQGVRIEKFVNSIGCKQAILPLADTKAYLDPMLYFPGQ